MGEQIDDLRLLHIDVESMFVISDDADRIERENDPEFSPGPRVVLVGCAQGNIVHVRHDVGEEIARSVVAIAKEEPPWRDPDVLPQCLGRILGLLSREQQTVRVGPALIHQLPNHVEYKNSATIVKSDSPEGEKTDCSLHRTRIAAIDDRCRIRQRWPPVGAMVASRWRARRSRQSR